MKVHIRAHTCRYTQIYVCVLQGYVLCARMLTGMHVYVCAGEQAGEQADGEFAVSGLSRAGVRVCGRRTGGWAGGRRVDVQASVQVGGPAGVWAGGPACGHVCKSAHLSNFT